MARFLKNVSYDLTAGNVDSKKGSQAGADKPIPGNKQYIANLILPDGYNHAIGVFSSKQTKEVFVFVYNDQRNHSVYKLNGYNQTFDMIYSDPLLNFQLNPEHFIHTGGCCLDVQYLKDPNGKTIKRSYLFFADGNNYQRCICIEDSISTFGFDANRFPYFSGNYNKEVFINMGVPTPKDCIAISEVAPDYTIAENNRLLFNTWQFRLCYIDVWGRPSEHGIISDMYIPGAGNCNPSSSNLARCLNLMFDAPPPNINQIQVEYRNCNETTWKKAETLDLFVGSTIGSWWNRSRNPDVIFDSNTHKITYKFCADKECEIVAPNETSRLQNPLPKRSKGVALVDKYVALTNNDYGFQPFSKELKGKIKAVVNAPTDVNPANTDVRNIRICVEIWSSHFGSQPIYNQGITGNDNLRYGWGQQGGQFQYKAFFSYLQYFKNPNQQGFVGYLAGTDAYTISKQFLLDEATGSFTEITDFKTPIRVGFTDKRYFQVFDFTNIPKGKYIFRIASHQSDPSIDKNYQSTSTTVWGQFAYVWRSGSNPQNTPIPVNDSKELIVDVCDKNYESKEDNKILTIFDTVETDAVVQSGYIKNTDELDEKQVGIELAKVTTTRIGNINGYSEYTDHNGFYWLSGRVNNATDSNRFTYRIFAACGCEFGEQFRGNSGTTPQLFTNNYYMNKSNCQDYQGKICSYVKIVGSVKQCGGDIGIPNVGVVLSRGGSTKTDENGNFTIIAHDDIRAGHRQDALYYITNSCGFTNCDGNCIDPYDIVIDKCVVCAERTIKIPDRFVLFFDIVRGLLSGGIYPWGVTAFDWLGRATFVQPLGNLKIPTFNETHVFAPSSIQVSIDPSAIFPAEIQYITFWIGAETTIEDYITWIIDDFEFVDNTGLVNQVAPTQIKIFYGSLIEFNKQNNYATTINWGFLDVNNNNTPVLADKVEFLFNGNGEFFDKPITALVKYDQAGQYILINYTEDLKNLHSNALIRLVRPKKCIDTEPYFEICSTINIINGKPDKQKFILNAWDTYYQKRQIPVPVLQTPANPNATPPTPDIFANELRIFGTPFESKNVSDFWGAGCWNVGRVSSKNNYETELFKRDEIALSGSLSDSGLLNYLSYFDNARKFSYDENSLNGIVSLIVKPGIVLIIGQGNSFTVGFNDNLLRVNKDSTVSAGSIENSFGKPSPTPGANYGCLLAYKNTIYEKNGLVQFIDSTKSWLIQHNFSIGYPISLDGSNSIMIAKIKAVDAYNNSHDNKRYFTGVVSSIGNEYIVTDFIIRSNNYINNLREFNVDVQETFRFNIANKTFLGCYSYTGECYGELEGEINDQQLFSFKNGIPYLHYNTLPNKTYNTFFGVSCESIMEFIIAIDPFKKERPLAIGQYCKQSLYFADRVITETGQESRILIHYWLQANFGWYAPFLCNLKTLSDPNFKSATGDNALLDGDQLTGTWVKVRLVNRSLEYSEFKGVTVEVFGVEKSGI